MYPRHACFASVFVLFFSCVLAGGASMKMEDAMEIDGDVCAMQASDGPALSDQNTMCFVYQELSVAGALLPEVRTCHGFAGAVLARVNSSLFHLSCRAQSRHFFAGTNWWRYFIFSFVWPHAFWLGRIRCALFLFSCR